MMIEDIGLVFGSGVSSCLEDKIKELGSKGFDSLRFEAKLNSSGLYFKFHYGYGIMEYYKVLDRKFVRIR